MTTDEERSVLQGIVTAIDAETAAFAPIVEGIRRELEGGNLSEEARRAATANLADYQARAAALGARRAIVSSLLEGGYPDLYTDLPPRTVPAAVLAELRHNLAVQQTALATYVPEVEMTTGAFELGPAEDKPNT